MSSIEFTEPHHDEARALIADLNSTLSQMTGNDDQGSRFERNFEPSTDAFVLIRVDGEAVACGAFRYFDATRCELKRMFSKVRGYGAKVLSALEVRALQHGYREIVISTRRSNRDAISFYFKHGYVETEPFGKYRDPSRSIYLKKQL